MHTLTSNDGTTIAWRKTGTGPSIIIISNVAEDHTGVMPLADALSEHFTVICFDRRGRGSSGDPQPYQASREIEDIALLIKEAGGSAVLASGSGACAITLDAASALGERVRGVYLYEPPFIVDDSRPPVPTDYIEHLDKLLAAGERDEAVEYVMTDMIRVPAEFVAAMKQDPSWREMVRYAHTFAYENRNLSGLMDGMPLPTDRWSIAAPVAIAVGSESEEYFRAGARELSKLFPKGRVLALDGHDHGAFWAAPQPVAKQIREFLSS